MYINKHDWVEAIVFWDQELSISNEIDVYYLIHEFSDKRGKNISKHLNFKTHLHSDNPEEKFSSSTRRKWRKLFGYSYSLSTDLSEDELNNLTVEYNKFATQNNLTKMNVNLYREINKEKKLYVSKAFQNDDIKYIHTFYVSNGISRLFHTFPVNNSNRDLNIGLHRFDLLEFKKIGVLTYDWGGAGLLNEKDEKKLAIREYKRRFGGEEFTYYKARIPGNNNGIKIIKDKYKF